MSISTPYFLNVALHAAILSVIPCLMMVLLKQARHRSVIAISGLLVVGLFPWISALRQTRSYPTTVSQTEVVPQSIPTWTIASLPAPATKAAEIEAPIPGDTMETPVKFVFPDLPTTGLALWLAGSVIGLLLLITAGLRNLIWRRSLRHPYISNLEALDNLALRIPDSGRVLICETRSSPCIIGFWKPRIVLPRFLFEPGSEEKLRWAVKHELAHIHAGDSRWVIVFAVVRCANWWNPLIHRLTAIWAETREQLCDFHAAGTTGDRADYGEFLIAMARTTGTRTPLAVPMTGRSHVGRLKRRIVSLLEAGPDSAKPVGRRFIGIGCLVCATFAIFVSSVRIGAEELSQEKDTPETSIQKQDETGQLAVDTTMIFSRKALGPKNGEVLKAGELAKLVEKAKIAGWSIDSQTESQADGESHTFELSQITIPGPDSGTASEWRRPRPNDSPGNGISSTVSTQRESDLTNLSVRSQYRFMPGSAYPASLGAPKPYKEGSKFKFKQASAKSRLKYGEALSINFGEVEPGVFLQIFATAVPTIPSGGSPIFTSAAPRLPSAEVKGRWRISGMRITAGAEEVKTALEKFPVGSFFRNDEDVLTLTADRTIETWRYVLGSKIQTLPPIEFPLGESHVPWPSVPGFEISVIASDDFKNIGIVGKPPQDGVHQGNSRVPWVPIDFPMTFKLRSDDPKTASRVFFKIELLK